MPKKLHIALLLGGTSSERKVSLKTGEQIFKYLDRKKYFVKKYDPKFDLEKISKKSKEIDLAFLALHGKVGEDGTIQKWLESNNIFYTGSGVKASSLAMDKIASKKIFLKNKILTPEFKVLKKFGKNPRDPSVVPISSGLLQDDIHSLRVIKPSDSGSSVGVSIVKKQSQIKPALKKAFKESEKVIVEKFINGLELSVPILGDKALPVIEIIPKTEFFDYQAKYIPAFCKEIVPARISSILTKKAQEIALKAHQSLFCRGYSRVDMILDKQGRIWVLEVNTLPGLTANSLVPKSAKAAGIEFQALLDEIIKLSSSSVLLSRPK